MGTDCQAKRVSSQGVGEELLAIDTVVLEGLSTKEGAEHSSTEIVTNLLAELESISEKENLSGAGLKTQRSLLWKIPGKQEILENGLW